MPPSQKFLIETGIIYDIDFIHLSKSDNFRCADHSQRVDNIE